MSKARGTSLRHFFPHMVAASVALSIFPLITLIAFERITGIRSLIVSTALGIGFSLAYAFAGSALWRKLGTNDLVFADLLVWGYVRRIWLEKRLGRMTEKFQESLALARKSGHLSSQERTKLLTDLASVLEATDPYTHGHSKRVTRHSYMIARTMGLPKELTDKIRIAAAVHDVGKVHTPKEILHKPDRLTDSEFEIIKQHASKGADMVASLGDEVVTAMVRHHHERLDGTGYPQELEGASIPVGARVIAVADTFDAITSTRPYRSAARHKLAISILKKEAGKQLDANAVSAFLRYYSGRASIGWWAALYAIPQRALASLGGWVMNTVQVALPAAATVAVLSTIPAAEPIFPASYDDKVATTSSSRDQRRPTKTVEHGVETVGVEPSPSSASDDGEGSLGKGKPKPSPSPGEPGQGNQDPSEPEDPEPSPTPLSDSILELVEKLIEGAAEVLP